MAKEIFTHADWERALGNSFFHPEHLIGVFDSVFATYPANRLQEMGKEELESLVENLSKREDVRALHSILDHEVGWGQSNMRQITNVIQAQMKKVGVIPLQKGRVYQKDYQEAWVYSGNDRTPLAKSLLEHEVDLSVPSITPESVFYTDVPSLFKNGRLTGIPNPNVRKVAEMQVYRDQTDDCVLIARVREIIQKTADAAYTSVRSPAKRYESAEREIVGSLSRFFPAVVGDDGSVNYKKVYKIFEGVIRQNVDLGPIINNPYVVNTLAGNIASEIPMPYAVVRTRVKDRKRVMDKVIQTIYEISGADVIGQSKEFKDRFGIRIIVPDNHHIYDLFDQIKSVEAWSIDPERVKDYIQSPKDNGYQSLHFTISLPPINYEVQLRTHQMDKAAELGEEVGHRFFLAEKERRISEVPQQVIRVVGTLLNI